MAIADATLAPEQDLSVLELLGVPIVTGEPAVVRRALLERCQMADGAIRVAYANAHTLNLAASDEAFRRTLNRFDFVLNDGSGVALAARLKGLRLPANLNGSDFTPALLEIAAELDWPVYLLGSRPGVAETAAANLREAIPGLEVAGARDGYFEPGDGPAVAAAIRASGAKLLVVAMGNPLQERWVDEHLEETGAHLGVCVGAFLDFSAGRVRRAPRWMNVVGVEWLFRMAQEPRRMWRRYLVGNPLFVARVLREAARDRRRALEPPSSA
jgi:exopolysaccharide biosynthesis WecB/TagA/CpsF family protein